MDRPLTDNEPREGSFVKVIKGPHAGRYGVFLKPGTVGETGKPVTAVVRTRDDDDDHLLVEYKDIRPDSPGKR